MITIGVIKIKPMENPPGAMRGWADVRVVTDEGSIRINGVAIVESKDGGYFLSFPQRKDSKQDRWFSIVDVEGKLKDKIRDAVMGAYKNG